MIEAATSIFAGHDVRSIANADADNLHSAAARLVALIHQARLEQKRFLLILTGVPGSGKTLAFLLPVTQLLDKNSTVSQALIIVPSRELALQIEQVFKKMGKTSAVRLFVFRAYVVHNSYCYNRCRFVLVQNNV